MLNLDKETLHDLSIFLLSAVIAMSLAAFTGGVNDHINGMQSALVGTSLQETDYDIFMNCFKLQTDVVPGTKCAKADFNGDGFVGQPDYTLYLAALKFDLDGDNTVEPVWNYRDFRKSGDDYKIFMSCISSANNVTPLIDNCSKADWSGPNGGPDGLIDYHDWLRLMNNGALKYDLNGNGKVEFKCNTTCHVPTDDVVVTSAWQAQNIGQNIPNQPFGAFYVDNGTGDDLVLYKEGGTHEMKFNVVINSNNATVADITNIGLYNEQGTIVAGPVDGIDSATVARGYGTITFRDTARFSEGKTMFTLKGKMGTDFEDGDTVIVSTNPATDWKNLVGLGSGVTVTANNENITMPPTTVKGAALTISVASTPLAQTIVAGGLFTFANYIFDTSQSSEDVRMSALNLAFAGTGNPNNITNCTILDGDNRLVTGVNGVSPSYYASDLTFTFDRPYVFPRGRATTLSLNCGTSATTTGSSYQWGLQAPQRATGENTGESIAVNINPSPGQLITLSIGGAYTVTEYNSPGYIIVTPGTEVVLLNLKFSATTEDVDIKRVALQLAETNLNTPKDLVGRELTLWDGNNKIATAQISESGGTADYATSTVICSSLSCGGPDFRVPANGYKVMTVKGTIANISTTGPIIHSGDLLKVAWDANDAIPASPNGGGNYGIGLSGGAAILPSTTNDVMQGQGIGRRIMNAYPVFTKVGLSSSEKNLISGSDRTLYKFKIASQHGETAYAKLSFKVLPDAGVNVSNYQLYAYRDSSMSQADTTFSSDGALNGSGCHDTSGDVIEIYPDNRGCNYPITYNVNGDRWFVLKADISNTNTSQESKLRVALLGDAAYPIFPPNYVNPRPHHYYQLLQAHDVDGDVNDDLVWSPRSTSTFSSLYNFDWTNGYQVPGLPTTNMTENVLTGTGSVVTPFCGDRVCNNGETCSTCSSDCGLCSANYYFGTIPNPVAPGANVTATWHLNWNLRYINGHTPNAGDKIYLVSEPDREVFGQKNNSRLANPGSEVFTAPSMPGQYKFEYWCLRGLDGPDMCGVSDVFTVREPTGGGGK